MEKKSHRILGKIISISLVATFVLLSTVSLSSLAKLQGNARVINYTGIVRGATQRIVKQELAHMGNDELSQRIDEILKELTGAWGENKIITIPDPVFQVLAKQLQNRWAEIKKEIKNVRQGGDTKTLYEMSESYFTLADQTVSAAEQYSESSVQTAMRLMIGLNVAFISLGILFWYYSKKQKSMFAALKAAESASAEKSRFLSKVSHEMRTPMNGIIGMTSLAKLYENDPEKLHDCLIKIELSSKFLLSLINDTLDMSRIESGKVELVNAEFDLVQIIETIRTMFEQKAQEKKISFNIFYENLTTPILIGDSLRVSQIIINLLSNAVKFTPEGKDVSLTIQQIGADERSADIQFTVSDSGIGMNEEFMSRMFKPFEQADNSISHTYGGTGLGLTICHNLVQLMNGAISVSSKPAQGSQFIVNLKFQLPATTDPSTAFTGTPDGLHATSINILNTDYDFSDLRILLAEDNAINSEISIAMLENKNARVDHAWNGKEAVDMFTNAAEGTYQIILMDVQMPVMDGLEATRLIRSSTKSDATQIPILAASANSFRDDVDKALECGINAYLSKPIDIDKLYSEIQQFCHIEL